MQVNDGVVGALPRLAPADPFLGVGDNAVALAGLALRLRDEGIEIGWQVGKQCRVDEPRRRRKVNAERQYGLCRRLLSALKTEIVWYFAYIEWRTVRTALGKTDGLGKMALPVFLLLLFATLGYYIWQSRKAR